MIQFNANPTIQIQPIKIEKVVKTYIGKARTCCCGCAGNYAYANEKPLSVKRTITKINAAIKGELPIDGLFVFDTGVSIEIGDKTYTAYFS